MVERRSLLLGYRLVTALLTDPRDFARRWRGVPLYLKNLGRYWSAAEGGKYPSFRIRFRHLYPCLGDRYQAGGTASGHYFHQDIWAARQIFDASPRRHVDVGSRVDGFVAHLLVFREVEVVDLRLVASNASGLRFIQGDITDLPFEAHSLPSVSCLHAVEHVGLGRYGDQVDPEGAFRALRELQRVIAPGGRLYLSVPIGKERLEFDAHRVFSPMTIVETLTELRLDHFAAVDDSGIYIHDAQLDHYNDSHYACGLFRFVRPD